MKDEIKEILIKDFNEILVKEFCTDWKEKRLYIELLLNATPFTNLLNHITNLQEERNMFKGSFETMSKNYFEEKSRNEKAIEYIKIAKTNEENDNMKDYIYTKEDLLNILQGEDKECFLKRFKNAYDTLETKTNALKKKMESIKYEEFNN